MGNAPRVDRACSLKQGVPLRFLPKRAACRKFFRAALLRFAFVSRSVFGRNVLQSRRVALLNVPALPAGSHANFTSGVDATSPTTPRLIEGHDVWRPISGGSARTKGKVAMRGSSSRRLFVGLCLLGTLTGCAAFHPMEGVPARYLPTELKAGERNGKKTIDFSLLSQKPPVNYLIDSGDVLAVYVEGEVGRKIDPPVVHFPLNHEAAPSFGLPFPVREDGTISLFDLYVTVARNLAQSYLERELLATEHPLLDDSGDGRGTEVQIDFLTEEQGGRAKPRKSSTSPMNSRGDGRAAKSITLSFLRVDPA